MGFTYQYAASATAGLQIDAARLHQEITNAAYASAALAGVTLHGTGGSAVAHVEFTQELSESDALALSSLVTAHLGEPLPTPIREVTIAGLTPQRGQLPTTASKPQEDNDPIWSHDFCNKTTWWRGSLPFSLTMERVEDYNGTGRTVYRFKEAEGLYRDFIIDTEHGYLGSLEDRLDGKYRLRVYVDGVLQLVTKLWEAGNYACDYRAGEVEFAVDPGASAVVTATGYYAVSSKFLFYAPPNKQWSIDSVEIQSTEDAEISSPIHFETVIYTKDPDGVPIEPLDIGAGKMHAVSPRVYKNKWSMVIEANRYYEFTMKEVGKPPQIVQVHGYDYRGVKPLTNKLVYPPLPDEYAVVLEMFIRGDVELTGDKAVVTLYALTSPAVI